MNKPTIAEVLRAVPAANRGRLPILVGLMLVAGIAELVTLGALLAFLGLLAAPDRTSGLAHDLARLAGDRLELATLIFVFAALVAGMLRMALGWWGESFTASLGHRIAVEVHRRLIHQPYAFHLHHNSARVVALSEKVELFTHGVVQPLLRSAAATVIGLAIVIGLLLAAPLVTLGVILCLALFYIGIAAASRRRIAAISATTGALFDQRVRLVQETLAGVRDVILDHRHAERLRLFQTVDRQISVQRVQGRFIGSAPRYLVETAGIVALALLALALASRAGGIAAALPTLAVLALGAQRLLPLAQQFYAARTELAANRGVTAELLELLNLPLAVEKSNPAALPFTREIRFDAVGFAYDGRPAPAVQQASIAIPCGSRVALVGATGSGKTTVADLLMGLVQPDSGQISIDGTKLTATNARAWQRDIAHVSQAIFLSDDSIAHNIAGAANEPIDPERLAEAVRMAKLEDFVAGLPDGLDTLVGERGVRLSGGQRQRMGLARALYKQAPVLILDEATSAVDQATESEILRALQEGPPRTILIIAHRRSTIEGCDKVFVMDNGRIREAASVDEAFQG